MFAAAQIYNMLMEYKGDVTVKVDALAASAASVIAMAGTEVLMSPVGMMMIHNPMTIAIGDSKEMQRAGEMPDEVKESIMNAYEIKTGMGRATDRYKKTFWNAMRRKNFYDVENALQVGTDSEGGYLVPDEFEHTLVEALEEENFFQNIATVIWTSSGNRKIPVVATKGTASWITRRGLTRSRMIISGRFPSGRTRWRRC